MNKCKIVITIILIYNYNNFDFFSSSICHPLKYSTLSRRLTCLWYLWNISGYKIVLLYFTCAHISIAVREKQKNSTTHLWYIYIWMKLIFSNQYIGYSYSKRVFLANNIFIFFSFDYFFFVSFKKILLMLSMLSLPLWFWLWLCRGRGCGCGRGRGHGCDCDAPWPMVIDHGPMAIVVLRPFAGGSSHVSNHSLALFSFLHFRSGSPPRGLRPRLASQPHPHVKWTFPTRDKLQLVKVYRLHIFFDYHQLTGYGHLFGFY